MDNLHISYDKASGELVIRVKATDLTVARSPVSRSGKSRLVASTNGFVSVEGAPEGVRVGLNVIGRI